MDENKKIIRRIKKHFKTVNDLLTDFEAIVVEGSTRTWEHRKGMAAKTKEAQKMLLDAEQALIILTKT